MKMIALDMDGTLVNRDGTISIDTKRCMQRLFERGFKIGIATGRSFAEAKELLERNGIKPACGYPQYLICEERDIYTVEDNSYKGWENRNQAFLKEEKQLLPTSRQLIQKLENDLSIPFFVNNRVLQSSRGFVELFCVTVEEARQCFVYLEEASSSLAVKPIRNNRGISLRHAKVGKRWALEELVDKLGIAHDKVLVMGDSHNDMSMMTAGFLGATTANADYEVKEAVLSRGGPVSRLEASCGVADVLTRLFGLEDIG